MESHVKLFSSLGSKLGLNSEHVIKKARELHRLLQLKMNACHINITETCQIVICLDLAASALGFTFEKVDAIRLAGVTKKNYTSFCHTIEKLLCIQKKTTIRDLCVQFGVSEACSLADKLLEKYVKEGFCGRAVDLSHPMYNVAAVYAACKQSRLKVDRVKLVEQSHIQKSSFMKLAKTFEKYAEELNSSSNLLSFNVKEEEYKPTNLMKNIKEEGIQDFPKATDSSEIQSYEDWKRSILEDCD